MIIKEDLKIYKKNKRLLIISITKPFKNDIISLSAKISIKELNDFLKLLKGGIKNGNANTTNK